MNAIRIKQTVTEDGIFLSIKDLSQFINKKVEIIILPDEDILENKKFMKFAGVFDKETAEEFNKHLSDSRKIEDSEW